MANHDLFDFLQQSSRAIQEDYDRITARSREDPGTAGDEGEENWRALLRHWLPKGYHVVTKGRILFHSGSPSHHMDVLVLIPEYPIGLIEEGKKHYLAGGVIAAFECKLTLRAAEITQAFENARELSNGTPRRWGSPYRELHRPIIYGLLAHSHGWKSEGSRPKQNVTNGLTTRLSALRHPRELLDLVCVSDLGTWTSMRAVTPGQHQIDQNGIVSWRPPSSRSVYAGYGLHRSAEHPDPQAQFTNVGAMVVDVLRRISWERPELRTVASYFRSVTGLTGDSRGKARTWSPESVFSQSVQEELAKRDLQPPVNLPVIRDSEGPWSEWSPVFDPF